MSLRKEIKDCKEQSSQTKERTIDPFNEKVIMNERIYELKGCPEVCLLAHEEASEVSLFEVDEEHMKKAVQMPLVSATSRRIRLH